MKQVLMGTCAAPYRFATRYYVVAGYYNWIDDMGASEQIVTTPGTIRSLRFQVDMTLYSGDYWDITLFRNGEATTLTCRISFGGPLFASDMEHEVSVVAGDRICLRITPASSPTINVGWWSVEFESTNDKESLILGSCKNEALNNAATEYNFCANAQSPWDATEENRKNVIPTTGKIKDLYIVLSEAPGSGAEAYQFTLFKNGIATALTVTITGEETTGNDTAHPIDVVAEDVVSLECEPLNSPTNTPYPSWGFTFEAAIDGESILMSGDPIAIRSDFKFWYAESASKIHGTENYVENIAQPMTLKNLYADLSVAPGDGKSYSFIQRKNNEDTSLACVISGAATKGHSLESVEVDYEDLIGFGQLPTDTPAESRGRWSVVGDTTAAPPPPPPPASMRPTKRLKFHKTLKLDLKSR